MKFLAIKPPLLIFSSAIALSLLHIFTSTSESYYLTLHSDSRYFHQTALQILSGDIQNIDLKRTLSPVFLGYLTFFYTLFSPNVLVIRIFQCVLNAITCLLIYEIARQWWNKRAAFFAGAMAAFCGVFIFYTAEISKPTLVNFLVIASFWALFFLDQRKTLNLLLAVFLWTSACLLRMNLLLFFPFFVYILSKQYGQVNFKNQLKAFFLILFFSFCVVAGWNTWMRSVIPSNSSPMTQWGIHFYIGNHQENEKGTYDRVDGIRSNSVGHNIDAKRVVEESGIENPSNWQVNLYWLKKGVEEIVSHPRRWLWLELKKAKLLLNAYEVPSYENYPYLYDRLPYLRVAFIQYGFILPLALIGFFLVWSHRTNQINVVLFFLACYSLTLLIIFVRSDYRLPLYPFLILFAAYALDRLWILVQDKRWRRLAFVLAALAALVRGVNEPTHLNRAELDRTTEKVIARSLR